MVQARVRSDDESNNDVKRKADGRRQWADEEALSFLTFADSAILSSPERTLSGQRDCREERVRAARDANGLCRMNVAFNYVVNRSASAIQVIPREPEFNITSVIIAL